jgi:hypothetical protein
MVAPEVHDIAKAVCFLDYPHAFKPFCLEDGEDGFQGCECHIFLDFNVAPERGMRSVIFGQGIAERLQINDVVSSAFVGFFPRVFARVVLGVCSSHPSADVNCGESQRVCAFLGSEPDEHCGGSRKDVSHLGHLVIALRDIALVYAYCIGPEYSTAMHISEMAQNVEEGLWDCDWADVADLDRARLIRALPGV